MRTKAIGSTVFFDPKYYKFDSYKRLSILPKPGFYMKTSPLEAPLDVLIVGAGLSGIGAAVHLRQRCPQRRFAILEGRATSG